MLPHLSLEFFELEVKVVDGVVDVFRVAGDHLSGMGDESACDAENMPQTSPQKTYLKPPLSHPPSNLPSLILPQTSPLSSSLKPPLSHPPSNLPSLILPQTSPLSSSLKPPLSHPTSNLPSLIPLQTSPELDAFSAKVDAPRRLPLVPQVWLMQQLARAEARLALVTVLLWWSGVDMPLRAGFQQKYG